MIASEGAASPDHAGGRVALDLLGSMMSGSLRSAEDPLLEAARAIPSVGSVAVLVGHAGCMAALCRVAASGVGCRSRRALRRWSCGAWSASAVSQPGGGGSRLSGSVAGTAAAGVRLTCAGCTASAGCAGIRKACVGGRTGRAWRLQCWLHAEWARLTSVAAAAMPSVSDRPICGPLARGPRGCRSVCVAAVVGARPIRVPAPCPGVSSPLDRGRPRARPFSDWRDLVPRGCGPLGQPPCALWCVPSGLHIASQCLVGPSARMPASPWAVGAGSMRWVVVRSRPAAPAYDDA